MKNQYQIKKPIELDDVEIKTILKNWDVTEWGKLGSKKFKKMFQQSEFHLLTDQQSEMLCIARINFDFKLKIQSTTLELAELVGLVSVKKMKGHGRTLLLQIIGNLKSRKIECIGFCEKEVRPFYEQCEIPVLYDKAKFLREKVADKWLIPTDDDMLDITLSQINKELLETLNNDNLGYLIFE